MVPLPTKVQESLTNFPNLSFLICKIKLINITSKGCSIIKLDDVCRVLIPEPHAYSSLSRIIAGQTYFGWLPFAGIDFWRVFPILASPHGTFGLLIQEFPLVHLRFQVHLPKPCPCKVRVTWPEPSMNPVYLIRPWPYPSGTRQVGSQVAIAVCAVKSTIIWGPS